MTAYEQEIRRQVKQIMILSQDEDAKIDRLVRFIIDFVEIKRMRWKLKE